MWKMMKKTAACLLLTCILAGMPCMPGGASGAEESAPEGTVRVGCVDIDNFLVTAREGYTSGYAVEYLEKIAEHTGWEYEYVKGSWAECLRWLEEGRIDLLLPAEYSQERAEKYLFSEQMCCMDYAALVGRKDDDSYFYEDYEAFEGMRVGMIEGNYLNRLFDEYARKHEFGVEKVMYATGTQENKALENGEVDAIISGNMNFYENQKLLARIDFMPAYFITSFQNQELMERLNTAQNEITLESPYYTAALHEKYYGKIERQAVGFTREEAEYIKNAGPVRVLYETDDYPFEYQDQETGEARGIYLDIIRRIFDECGLTLEAVPGSGGAWPQAAAGESRTVLSAQDTPKNRERYGLEYTEGFFTVSYSLLGKRGGSIGMSEPLKVAVADGGRGAGELLEERYPNWEIVACGSAEECLESVKKGRTDLAFVNSLSQELAGAAGGNELLTVNADSVSVDICLGLNREGDRLLKAVLDKGIKKLDSQEVEQCVYNNILKSHNRISLSYLLNTYPAQAAAVLSAVSAALIFLVILFFHSRMNKMQNRILQEKNRELNEAIELQHKLQLECEQDPLTGLKNKGAVEKLCRSELENTGDGEAGYALLVLDVDDFKQVNDTRGHMMGDEVLKSIAACMRESFQNQIAGRIGGDEFIVLARVSGGREALQPQLDGFKSRVSALPLQAAVTCSIGIALSKGESESFEELFKRADRALYLAKNDGKNRCAEA